MNTHPQRRVSRQSASIERKLTFPGRVRGGGHLNGFVIPDAIVTLAARECLLTLTMYGHVVLNIMAFFDT